MTTPMWLASFVVVLWLPIIVLIVRKRRKALSENPVATVQQLADQAARLQALANRAIPIIQNAGNNIIPAALDPVLASLTQTADAIEAVLPPQNPPPQPNP